MILMLLTYIKYIYTCKNSTFCDGKVWTGTKPGSGKKLYQDSDPDALKPVRIHNTGKDSRLSLRQKVFFIAEILRTCSRDRENSRSWIWMRSTYSSCVKTTNTVCQYNYIQWAFNVILCFRFTCKLKISN